MASPFAWHEAGHAVIAEALGLAVDEVSIVRDGRVRGYMESADHVSLYDAALRSRVDRIDIRDDLDALAIVSAAGPMAQHRARTYRNSMSADEWADAGGEGDAAVLLALCERFGDGSEPWMRTMLLEAQRLVAENWLAIMELARRLTVVQQLDGDHTRAVIDLVDNRRIPA